MSLSAAVRSPRFWIAAQLLAIVIVGGLFGCWQVQTSPDTPDYIQNSRMPLDQSLRHLRTLGYPTLLRAVAVFSPDYAAVPWVHLAMLWPVVFLFDAAARRFGALPWQAFVVSSGFMYGVIQLLPLVALILTDFSAMVAAGAAVACLLWIAANPKSPWAWTGAAFFLMASYQIRPAYLFLIPLAPCLGIVLRYYRARFSGERFAWPSLACGLFVAAVLPFLAYCSFRWMMVGDFALVSFGGMSNVGLATEILDENLADHELPERYRPFARGIIEARKEQRLKPAFPGGWRVDMRAYEDNFSTNLFTVAEPVARRLFGEDRILRNQEIVRFSREVLLHRKGKFLLWAVQYWPRAILKVAYRYWILQAAVPITLLLFAIRRYRRGKCRCTPRDEWWTALNSLVLPAVLWLNLGYFGAAISLLIASGTCADSRLIVPAAVYLPSLFGLLILRELYLLGVVRPARLPS